MKKSLLTFTLVFAAAAFAQQAQPGAPASAPAAGQQPAGQAAPAQKKEIKDPAEYNAYVAAVQTQDPNAKATAIESFLTTYPNSVMKEDAAELLMSAYQQAGNMQKTIDAANRVLQSNPNNLRALALLTYLNRAQVQGGNANALQPMQQSAQRGLQALQTAQKPEGLSDADWTKLKDQVSVIFNGAAGFAALQSKDYNNAQQYLHAAVKANPNNFLDVYPLALAHLEKNPPDVEGLFWIARAASLAPTPEAQNQVQKYARSRYLKYHGGEEGFNELMAAAKTATEPPAGFNVAPAPSPADQARDMVAQKDVKQMSFGEWQFILSSGNQQAAEKVWTTIKGTPLQLGAQVITASPTKLELAATTDDIDAKRADVIVNLKTPLTRLKVPKPGQQVEIIGTPDSYTPDPFVMTLSDGTMKGAEGGAPAKKPTAGRTPAKRRPQ